MLSEVRASVCVALFLGLSGCSAEDALAPTSRCPSPAGEFPPDGCALVSGRVLRSDGSPLANAVVSLDTAISERNFRLLATERSTDRFGRFSLLVYVVAPLGTAISFDPVTADVQVRRSGQGSAHSVRTVLPLAALGQEVDVAQLVVTLPP
jgi:hypothetical protein